MRRYFLVPNRRDACRKGRKQHAGWVEKRPEYLSWGHIFKFGLVNYGFRVLEEAADGYLPPGVSEGSRYHELVTKYGKLEKLAVVDLRPQSSAKVEVHFKDQVEEMTVRLDQTVAELKKQLKTLVQLPISSMLVTHCDHEAPFGPEEMKYNSRALHSYGIRDGDIIYVDSKAK
uniref:Uncharacterized protein n=1 Tax=Sphaerodactylus townsendi TaxID=933632 RepID=A0ACB8EXP8_9SAUR